MPTDAAGMLRPGALRALLDGGAGATLQVLQVATLPGGCYVSLSDTSEAVFCALPPRLAGCVQDDALRIGQLCAVDAVAPAGQGSPCPVVVALAPLEHRCGMIGAPREINGDAFRAFADGGGGASPPQAAAAASASTGHPGPPPVPEAARGRKPDPTVKAKKERRRSSSRRSSSGAGAGAAAAGSPAAGERRVKRVASVPARQGRRERLERTHTHSVMPRPTTQDFRGLANPRASVGAPQRVGSPRAPLKNARGNGAATPPPRSVAELGLSSFTSAGGGGHGGGRPLERRKRKDTTHLAPPSPLKSGPFPWREAAQQAVEQVLRSPGAPADHEASVASKLDFDTGRWQPLERVPRRSTSWDPFPQLDERSVASPGTASPRRSLSQRPMPQPHVQDAELWFSEADGLSSHDPADGGSREEGDGALPAARPSTANPLRLLDLQLPPEHPPPPAREASESVANAPPSQPSAKLEQQRERKAQERHRERLKGQGGAGAAKGAAAGGEENSPAPPPAEEAPQPLPAPADGIDPRQKLERQRSERKLRRSASAGPRPRGSVADLVAAADAAAATPPATNKLEMQRERKLLERQQARVPVEADDGSGEQHLQLRRLQQQLQQRRDKADQAQGASPCGADADEAREAPPPPRQARRSISLGDLPQRSLERAAEPPPAPRQPLAERSANAPAAGEQPAPCTPYTPDGAAGTPHWGDSPPPQDGGKEGSGRTPARSPRPLPRHKSPLLKSPRSKPRLVRAAEPDEAPAAAAAAADPTPSVPASEFTSPLLKNVKPWGASPAPKEAAAASPSPHPRRPRSPRVKPRLSRTDSLRWGRHSTASAPGTPEAAPKLPDPLDEPLATAASVTPLAALLCGEEAAGKAGAAGAAADEAADDVEIPAPAPARCETRASSPGGPAEEDAAPRAVTATEAQCHTSGRAAEPPPEAAPAAPQPEMPPRAAPRTTRARHHLDRVPTATATAAARSVSRDRWGGAGAAPMPMGAPLARSASPSTHGCALPPPAGAALRRPPSAPGPARQSESPRGSARSASASSSTVAPAVPSVSAPPPGRSRTPVGDMCGLAGGVRCPTPQRRGLGEHAPSAPTSTAAALPEAPPVHDVAPLNPLGQLAAAAAPSPSHTVSRACGPGGARGGHKPAVAAAAAAAPDEGVSLRLPGQGQGQGPCIADDPLPMPSPMSSAASGDLAPLLTLDACDSAASSRVGTPSAGPAAPPPSWGAAAVQAAEARSMQLAAQIAALHEQLEASKALEGFGRKLQELAAKARHRNALLIADSFLNLHQSMAERTDGLAARDPALCSGYDALSAEGAEWFAGFLRSLLGEPERVYKFLGSLLRSGAVHDRNHIFILLKRIQKWMKGRPAAEDAPLALVDPCARYIKHRLRADGAAAPVAP